MKNLSDSNIVIHDLFKMGDIIIMVIDLDSEYEYYVRDRANNFPFQFVFGVLEEFTRQQLEGLYIDNYFDSFLEVEE